MHAPCIIPTPLRHHSSSMHCPFIIHALPFIIHVQFMHHSFTVNRHAFTTHAPPIYHPDSSNDDTKEASAVSSSCILQATPSSFVARDSYCDTLNIWVGVPSIWLQYTSMQYSAVLNCTLFKAILYRKLKVEYCTTPRTGITILNWTIN